MDRNQILIVSFVQNKVQNRFLILANALKQFIDVEAPVIEETNAFINLLGKKVFNQIEVEEIRSSISRDIEGAKKSMANYRRTFGRIDHHLGMISSNYQLPNFIQENGLSYNDIFLIQEEIKIYWGKTYAPLFSSFSIIKEKMYYLIDLLQKELVLLQSLPNINYIDGFQKSKELNLLFEQERKTFWEIVDLSKRATKEIKQVESMYKIHKNKTKELIVAHLKIIKLKVNKDFKESEANLKKALLVLCYLAGAVNLYLNLKQILFTKSTKSLFGMISKKDNSSEIMKKIAKNISNLNGSALSEIIKSF